MCESVSRIFWNLVKSSIVSELDKLKEQLFLLETEWKAQDILIYWSIFKVLFLTILVIRDMHFLSF